MLRQDALKREVNEWKEKVGKVFISLRSLMDKRENQERMAANVRHHDTMPQSRDVNRHSSTTRCESSFFSSSLKGNNISSHIPTKLSAIANR